MGMPGYAEGAGPCKVVVEIDLAMTFRERRAGSEMTRLRLLTNQSSAGGS